MSALKGIRVLDLSRVLAGPLCTQILGDLGADILKIERPGEGDDTRKWGPPFLKDADGKDTSESAYYLSVNRNKRSLAIDLTNAAGQKVIHALIEKADVLIQNFKVGGLEKYGLGYEQLKKRYPALVYCTITGFGRNGPLAEEPGYDFLAQAMGGLMASTGTKDGEPMKAGVALSDVMTGLYATIGILAALHKRGETGEGQLVDVSLLDCTIAGMVNLAQFYLTSGKIAPRLGNAHSTIVPYQVFASADGYVIFAVGNDGQFKRMCKFIGRDDLAADEKFATNPARVKNRAELVPMLEEIIAKHPTSYWVDNMRECDVPVGPVNNMQQVFAMDQIAVREMKIGIDHELSPEKVELVGNPMKLSGTPVTYRTAPPYLGQHSDEVLCEWLGMDNEALGALRKSGALQ